MTTMNSRQPSAKTPPETQPTAKMPEVVNLRLYIARLTPNSLRAEENLNVALKSFLHEDIILDLQVIDVFTHGKRAVLDNVIVTPTLILHHNGKTHTIVGDLSNTKHLEALISNL